MSHEPLDLDEYLDRVEYRGSRAATAETLTGLHLAHATHIPFENLDLQLGKPIRIDLESLSAKLVRGRRGGYCFEQNTLFAAVLERFGFAVTKLAARVRWGTTRLLPRTHMLLNVEASGRSWLADVGFGAAGLLEPLPFEVGPARQQGVWSFRLHEESGTFVMQTLDGGAWRDMYAFTLEAQHHVDFEVANHYVSTHPDSRFVVTLTAQRPGLDVRYSLQNRDFTERRGDAAHTRTIGDDEEILAVLAEKFGLDFPSGTRFRALMTL